MKKLLYKLTGGGSKAQPEAATEDAVASGPRLNEQLSSKARHPSVIPGSFYERDQEFKEQSAGKGKPLTVVPPRTEGTVSFKQGKLSLWAPAWAKIEGSTLVLYPPAPADTTPPQGTPIKRTQLVGFHLTASKSPEEFIISSGEGGSGSVITIKAGSAGERDEWLVALGKVPGLFRRVEDYYHVGRTWGQGATSEVFECTGRFTGRRLALKKRLHNTRDATSAMHNELRILQLCAKHPNPAIPILHDFFFDTSGRIELIMELMEGGELFDWIAGREDLTEDDARAVFRQVVMGVAHLHSIGIAHRDLKPQNLMYVAPSEEAGDGATIKIMDYDLAKVNYSPEWEGSTPCGTVQYMAPEVVRREKYSLAIDCWSLGVILYILLTGCMPFQGKNDALIEGAIEKGEYSMQGQIWDSVSEEAKDLVRKLLKLDPVERLTAAQCLEHPWLAPVPQKSASAISSVRSFPQPCSPGRSLRTIENLRQLSGSLPGSRSGTLGSSGSLTRMADKFNATAVVGSIPESPGKSFPSPLSKALDYNLEPLRRQASLKSGQAGKGGLAGEEDDVTRLRITLDLVGTEAGIVDSRAVGLGATRDGGFMPCSPVMTSPLGVAMALASQKKKDDEFADLDASFVVEEERQESPDGADGELQEEWG